MSEINKFFRLIAMIIWTITFVIVTFMVLYVGLAALSAGLTGTPGFNSTTTLVNFIKFYTCPVLLFVCYIVMFYYLKKSKSFNKHYAKIILVLGVIVFFIPIVYFAITSIDIFRDKFSVVFSIQVICMIPVVASYISTMVSYMESREIK